MTLQVRLRVGDLVLVRGMVCQVTEEQAQRLGCLHLRRYRWSLHPGRSVEVVSSAEVS